jgi:hypothetical protein
MENTWFTPIKTLEDGTKITQIVGFDNGMSFTYWTEVKN